MCCNNGGVSHRVVRRMARSSDGKNRPLVLKVTRDKSSKKIINTRVMNNIKKRA